MATIPINIKITLLILFNNLATVAFFLLFKSLFLSYFPKINRLIVKATINIMIITPVAISADTLSFKKTPISDSL